MVRIDDDAVVRVETPGGAWHVRRRWAPRHLGADTIPTRFRDRARRVRRRSADAADLADPGCAPDVGEAIVGLLAVIAIVLFMIFFGLPFLIALGELILVGFLALVGVAGRVLFRRPWTVDAVDPTGRHHTWSVVGWRASGAARQFIADRVTTTGAVPTPAEVSAAVLAS